jgi:hypothetical protein
VEEDIHLMAVRKQERERRGQGTNISFEVIPPYDGKISN